MKQTLDDIANNWYARQKKLYEVASDNGRSLEHRAKAFSLMQIMMRRLFRIKDLYAKMSMPKNPSIFPCGGIVISGKETILNNQTKSKQ